MQRTDKRIYAALFGLPFSFASGVAEAAPDGVTITNAQTIYTVPAGTLAGDNNGINVTSTGSVSSIDIPGVSSIIGTNNAGIFNAGSITADALHRPIDNRNAGNVIYGAVAGIYNASGASISSNVAAWSTIYNSGTIGKFGSLYSTYGIYNAGIIEYIAAGGTFYAIRNDAGGTITGSAAGIYNDTSGVIRNTVGPSAIFNTATISSIVNLGSIVTTAPGGTGHAIQNSGTIGTITNSGTISATGTGYGISNTGTITTLNNAQSTLTYTGKLPTNYGIIVNSLSSYGKLSGFALTANSTTFGIYSGSTLLKGTYASVLTGLTSGTHVSSTSGVYNGTAWSLVLNSGTTWDLVVQSSATNTLQSVQLNADGLARMYNQQAATYQAALSYDCQAYDAKNICVTVGGRYNHAGPSPSAEATSGVVIAGYRPTRTFRFGGFIDQSAGARAPTGFSQSMKHPTWGAFGKWNRNADSTGLSVQASTVVSSSTLTVTRSLLLNTEAGSGNTPFNGRGYQLSASYYQPMGNSIALVPYLGLRYTRVRTSAYTEDSSATVTSPLTYNAMVQRNFSAIAGLGIHGMLSEKVSGMASAGVQQSLKQSMTNYQGTSGITGLESFSVQMPSTRNATANATATVYYDIERNARIGFNVNWQQQAFVATNTKTALATYTVGF